MKKVLKLLFPPAIILLLFILLQKSNYILTAIYVFFPLVFIIAALNQKSIKSAALCLVLSSVAFIVPFNLWLSMGSGIDLLLIYVLLFSVSFIVKNKALSKAKR